MEAHSVIQLTDRSSLEQGIRVQSQGNPRKTNESIFPLSTEMLQHDQTKAVELQRPLSNDRTIDPTRY